MMQHSRRTIVKGAAWTVPAVIIIEAVPAWASASAGPSVSVVAACKDPGQSQGNDKLYTYEVTLTFTNNDATAHAIIVAKADSYKNNGDPAGLNPFTPIPDTFPLAGSGSATRLYTSVDNVDSENSNVVFTYYVDGQGPFTVSVDNFHPCQANPNT